MIYKLAYRYDSTYLQILYSLFKVSISMQYGKIGVIISEKKIRKIANKINSEDMWFCYSMVLNTIIKMTNGIQKNIYKYKMFQVCKKIDTEDMWEQYAISIMDIKYLNKLKEKLYRKKIYEIEKLVIEKPYKGVNLKYSEFLLENIIDKKQNEQEKIIEKIKFISKKEALKEIWEVYSIAILNFIMMNKLNEEKINKLIQELRELSQKTKSKKIKKSLSLALIYGTSKFENLYKREECINEAFELIKGLKFSEIYININMDIEYKVLVKACYEGYSDIIQEGYLNNRGLIIKKSIFLYENLIKYDIINNANCKKYSYIFREYIKNESLIKSKILVEKLKEIAEKSNKKIAFRIYGNIMAKYSEVEFKENKNYYRLEICCKEIKKICEKIDEKDLWESYLSQLVNLAEYNRIYKKNIDIYDKIKKLFDEGKVDKTSKRFKIINDIVVDYYNIKNKYYNSEVKNIEKIKLG